MTDWALSLRRSEASALSKLHAVGEVVVADPGDHSELVWARGRTPQAELGAVLGLVPTSSLYEIVGADRLRPIGKFLPTATLPGLQWMPLSQWLRVRAPSAARPGELSGPVIDATDPVGRVDGVDRVELVVSRSAPRTLGSGCEELSLCRVEVFREFLLRAPAHRLAPLVFVVNDTSEEVLVRGWPAPFVPAERYILDSGVATPVGYGWAPTVSAFVIRAWLGTREDAFVLWRSDGRVSEIAQGAFTAASRRAGRSF